MKKLILKIYGNDVIRYVFWGGCTTLVNLVSFYIMRLAKIPLMTANVISIILAILFAYIVNSRFVFHDNCETLKDHIRPFVKFISARLATMVIEVGGVWLLAVAMGLNDMIAKFCTQFIVLVLNYIFSKFLILRYKAVSVLRVEKDSEIDLDTKDVFRYPIGTIHNQKVNLA